MGTIIESSWENERLKEENTRLRLALEANADGQRECLAENRRLRAFAETVKRVMSDASADLAEIDNAIRELETPNVEVTGRRSAPARSEPNSAAVGRSG